MKSKHTKPGVSYSFRWHTVLKVGVLSSTVCYHCLFFLCWSRVPSESLHRCSNFCQNSCKLFLSQLIIIRGTDKRMGFLWDRVSWEKKIKSAHLHWRVYEVRNKTLQKVIIDGVVWYNPAPIIDHFPIKARPKVFCSSCTKEIHQLSINETHSFLNPLSLHLTLWNVYKNEWIPLMTYVIAALKSHSLTSLRADTWNSFHHYITLTYQTVTLSLTETCDANYRMRKWIDCFRPIRIENSDIAVV